jgi:hypothetical protein
MPEWEEKCGISRFKNKKPPVKTRSIKLRTAFNDTLKAQIKYDNL